MVVLEKIMIQHIFKKILSGEVYNIQKFSERSSVNEEYIKEAFEKLENEGVLIKITENRYVLGDVDKEYAINKIRKESAQLQKKTSDKTKVKVSGELMEEDIEFETDSDPSDIIK